jgi:hypothetical protein
MSTPLGIHVQGKPFIPFSDTSRCLDLAGDGTMALVYDIGIQERDLARMHACTAGSPPHCASPILQVTPPGVT